ncbi:MAG TPA: hypothetical protein VFB38_19475 [Chthonomonadaceae bacterium]|nr:hypothetical protein [Chthonomonadaceae bacterium]
MTRKQDIADLLEYNRRLQEQREALRQALAFYADSNNYRESREGNVVLPPAVLVDGGQRARAALSTLPPG